MFATIQNKKYFSASAVFFLNYIRKSNKLLFFFKLRQLCEEVSIY